MAALPSTTWKKYDSYDLEVDPKQDDRATELKFSNFSRPHMMSFYVSTFSFFMAFCCWFSFAPLVAEGTVKSDLGLTKDEISNANIAALSSTVVARLILGPMCDGFGARYVMAGLLFFGAIPTMCQGLVQGATGLAVCRFFVGFLGATFVANQAWSSAMFAKKVVGRANATSAGWGNLGGGVTHLIMVGLYEGYKKIMSTEMAWRVSFIVPGVIVMLCAFATLLGDDCPKGNYNDLIKHQSMVRKSSKKSAESAFKTPNSWILALHYACSFGIELVVFNVSTSYFVSGFGMKIQKAALVSAAFGFFNIFSRPGGGYLSDTANKSFGGGSTGMRGRILVHFILMICSGAMLLAFSYQEESLGGSIACLIAFAVTMQAVNGSTYSIVPYVAPEATGAVSGMAGAGGNVGAVCWSLIFRFGPTKANVCFRILAIIVLCTTVTIPFISIKGYDSLFGKAKGEMASVDTDDMDGKSKAPTDNI